MKEQKTELMVRVVDIEKTALAIQVTDQESLTRANQGLIVTKDMLKLIGESFDEGIGKAHDLHKTLIAKKKNHTDPVNRGRQHLKVQIDGYFDELDRVAQVKKAAEEEKERKKREKIVDQELPAPVVKAHIPEIKPMMTRGVHIRQIVQWKLMDLKKVPRKYKMTILNKAMIDAEVKNKGIEADIPGVEVFKVHRTIG